MNMKKSLSNAEIERCKHDPVYFIQKYCSEVKATERELKLLRSIFPMEKSAIELFAKIMSGRYAGYRKKMESGDTIFKHPLTEGDNGLFYEWTGFDSDSWMDAVRLALTDSSSAFDGTLYVCFWKANYSPRKPYEQNQIWLEIGDELERYLCSGMTDYSGSGGAAYKDAKKVIEFLEEQIPGAVVESRVVSMEQMDNGWKSVNKELENVDRGE